MHQCNAELCVSGQILVEMLTLEKVPIPNLLLLLASETYPPWPAVFLLPVILSSHSFSVLPRKVCLGSQPGACTHTGLCRLEAER